MSSMIARCVKETAENLEKYFLDGWQDVDMNEGYLE